MKVKPVLATIFVCIVASAAAVELPLYARWQSRHSAYYHGFQTGKELSWDELYQAEIGIEKARWESFDLSFALSSEEFFDSARILLKSISLGYYDADARWDIRVGSRGFGYGKNTFLQQNPVLNKGYQNTLYQNMRLNSVANSLEYGQNSVLKLELGGNLHNQACVIISQAMVSDSKHYELSLDMRAMDNHWRTPLVILGLDISCPYGALAFEGEAAVAALPGWEATVAHQEYFGVMQLSYQAWENTKIATAAYYQKQNYAPQKQSEYQVRLEQDFGNFSLIPLVNLQKTDDTDFWQARLLGSYRLWKNSQCSVYYDYSFFETNQARHSLGLAVDFLFPAF